MEGSKMHHDIESSKGTKLTDNKEGPSSLPSDKSLSEFLSNLGPSPDDYYDDVEQQRTKLRGGKNDQYNANDDSAAAVANSASFDPNTLFDTGDDYSDSSLLLELANLKKKSGSDAGSGGGKNPFLDRVKQKLNNLIPQTITSERDI